MSTSNKDYLNELIAKAKKSWEGVDVDSYMENLRDMDKETIRCRDLMVGDWITDEHRYPMQIVVVGEDYAYATFEGLEGDPLEFDDKDYPPYPIEITDDIMRKNKWEEHSYPLPLPHNLQEYYYVKDESGNHLVWNSEVFSIWLDWEKDKEEGAYANIAIPIKYVHQLQQVLRLAGLTEMANNFKV